VRLFSWNFPSYALPGQSAALAQRLDPQQIHQNVRRAATELVTPFSTWARITLSPIRWA
jgi:hypothetical protein